MPTALITGASGGVGAQIARALAPTHDLLLGGRGSAELDTLAMELDGAATFPVDLTDHDSLDGDRGRHVARRPRAQCGGREQPGSVADTPADEWRYLLEVISSPLLN